MVKFVLLRTTSGKLFKQVQRIFSLEICAEEKPDYSLEERATQSECEQHIVQASDSETI